MDQTSTPDYEFEGFRLDTAQQVLVSPGGEPIALPSRAFETLKFLVERAGELVEKSALMQAVWPRAVVEENNLSQCILILRRAFGEEAGQRRFILTVPGRGFKFVASVTVTSRARPGVIAGPSLQASASSTEALSMSSSYVAIRPRRGHSVAVAIGIGGAVFLAALAMLLWQRDPGAPAVGSAAEYEALTDFADSVSAPALSPDGHLLAFIRGDGPFLSSGQIWLKLLPDGQPVQLTHSSDLLFAPTFTPDGTHIAYSATGKSQGGTWNTWTVPITGGDPIKLLPNASGLTFSGAHAVMYSEFKSGVHLGVVSSLDDRSHHREIYFPAHERAMAHYSYLSPVTSALWRMDIAGIQKEPVLSGFAVKGYDVSADEQRLVFATGRGAGSQIWIASLDRHAPPTMLMQGGDQPAFDRAGNIYYRELGAKFNYLRKMQADGSLNHRVLPRPIVEFHAVEPGGRIAVVDLPDESGLAGAWLVPLDGAAPTLIRKGWWPSRWSPDGRRFYLEIGATGDGQVHGRTAALPVGPAGMPEQAALISQDSATAIPLAEESLAVSADPSVYVFVRSEIRRNLYRIPLH